jgi:CheY-like chemotaxis protein
MRRKLLLADDSVTIQRVIELTFADEDVQVFAVGDGKKAIASIEADRPDIVLADIGMPERDGYEVAAFIKGNPQLASIPVLLLTGAFEPIDETRARAVGCDGVLVKPFEPQMVINRVKDLLAGRRPAGLWAASPAAQGTARQPAAVEKPLAALAADSHAAPVGTGGTLEDYFDRLDAAFANLEAGGQPEPSRLDLPSPGLQPSAHPSAAPAQAWRDATPFSDPAPQRRSSAMRADILDGWDPDLVGDPRKVEPLGTPAAAEPAPPSSTHETAAAPVVAAQTAPIQGAARHDSVARSEAVVAPDAGASVPAAPAPAPIAPAPTVAAPVASAAATAEPAAPIAAPAPSAQPIAPIPAPAPPAQPVAAVPAPAVPAQPIAALPTPAVPAQPVPAPVMPTLAEAFATLLAAEQSRRILPSSLAASSVSDETVDDIVRRVIARMGEQAVRDTVVDVAERLVREEIDRIKSSAPRA